MCSLSLSPLVHFANVVSRFSDHLSILAFEGYLGHPHKCTVLLYLALETVDVAVQLAVLSAD